MQVETYEVEEISGELGVMAADSAAIELIEKLGLKGQNGLMNKETATRNPYRLMSQLEVNVFAVLFPQHTNIEQYSSEPIPLRVLQVAAHAKDCGMFKRLEVWHPTDAQVKDPVLVGMGPDPREGWAWNERPYILARWGSSLLPMEELAEKAKKAWMAITKPKLLALKTKIDCELGRLEVIAATAFNGGGELEQLQYTV